MSQNFPSRKKPQSEPRRELEVCLRQEPPRPRLPTAQGPDPLRLPVEAYLLAWRKDFWGSLLKHLGLLWVTSTAIVKAVGWWFDTTERVVKTKVLSWTGDTKVITRGDLADAFQRATSAQLGDLRLVVKSDLAGIENRLDGLESRTKRLEVCLRSHPGPDSQLPSRALTHCGSH